MKAITIQDLRSCVKNHGLIRLGADYNQDDPGNQEDINADVLDVQTANMLITVYDALGSEQQTKFVKYLNGPRRYDFISKMWKLVK